MDRYLLSGSFVLLLFEIFVLMADLQILPFPPLYSSDQTQQQIVGSIDFKKQNVKRKSLESILWESAESQQTLYAFDSILTLSESTARLKLQNDIHLDLHENTLVVLEPTDQETDSPLRLKFSRGDMKARTKKQKLKFKKDNWNLVVEPGTHLSLRSIQGKKTELEVTKGSIGVTHSPTAKATIVDQGQKLTFDKEKVLSTQTISNELTWNFDKDQRVYSHNFPTQFQLNWKGPAEYIRGIAPDKKEFLIQVSPTARSHILEVSRGHYTFFLRNPTEVSLGLSLEAWKAPKIQYFRPLPRDRMKTGEDLLFSWSKTSPDHTYRLEVFPVDQPTVPPLQLTVNGLITSQGITFTGKILWQVVAKDDLGFEIPPPYRYPLYSVPNPLMAPKLRAPSNAPKFPQENSEQKKQEIKYKIQKSSGKKRTKSQKFSVWNLLEVLFPVAHAQEHPQTNSQGPSTNTLSRKNQESPPHAAPPILKRSLIFSWYEVPGADFYVIEISSQPNFRSPEIIEKTPSLEFEWSNFKEKTYYWRVAGGQKNGAMGLFSEPVRLDLSKIKPGELSPGVRYKITKLAPPPAPQIQKSKAKIIQEPEKKKAPLKQPVKKAQQIEIPLPTNFIGFHGGLSYLSANHFLKESAPDQVESSLSGISQLGIQGWASYPYRKGSLLLLQYEYFQMDWVPESSKKIPFQREFTSTNYMVSLLHQFASSNWAWGLFANNRSSMKRASTETVELFDWSTYGGSAQLQWKPDGPVIARHEFSIGTGDQFQSYHINNLVIYQVLSKTPLNLDVGAELDVTFYDDSKGHKGFHGHVGLQLGLSW